jgi:putative ABC transport system ATP-binding protein
MTEPSTPGKILLRAEGLSRSVMGKILVEGISFSVNTGGVLAVLGPSGSGKSSLLRLLNRLDEPDCGNVFLDGIEYRKIAPRELRQKIGMVMQRAYLFPGTVARNLQFGPQQRNEMLNSDLLEKLLTEVGLAGYARRDVANLSGGEAQRVSLARTLANRPEVLLLDEPTSALDADSKAGVEAILQGVIVSQQLACVWVTHDREQAARVATRALLLEHGRAIKIAAVAELIHA